MNYKLLIDTLITIDEDGMPQPPTTRQMIDKDVRSLYNRDKTKDKSIYIAECIVIYYLGDPKSPANQSGLNKAESLIGFNIDSLLLLLLSSDSTLDSLR